MMSDNEKKVYEVLNELNIPYIKHEHEPVFTVEEANRLGIKIPGGHYKNLFICNSKGSEFYLVILSDYKRADLKKISMQMGCGSLHFASEDKLYHYMGLTPGSVSPFGLINNTEKNVKVLLDRDMEKSINVNFHPNVNTSTLTISFEDFKKFLSWCGNQVYYLT